VCLPNLLLGHACGGMGSTPVNTAGGEEADKVNESIELREDQVGDSDILGGIVIWTLCELGEAFRGVRFPARTPRVIGATL